MSKRSAVKAKRDDLEARERAIEERVEAYVNADPKTTIYRSRFDGDFKDESGVYEAIYAAVSRALAITYCLCDAHCGE